MLYKYSSLSQLNYNQLLEIAQSILICENNLNSTQLIDTIIKHQKIFGTSEVVNANYLEQNDFILMKTNIPSFSKEIKTGWSKILRCYEIDAEEEDIPNFFDKYLDIFISNQSHIDLINNISNKMVYIEAISTIAAGNKTINCQNVIRAKVLPKFNFVRKV